jgi:hypothetical protein
VVGYYNQFDIFKLQVDRGVNRPVYFRNEVVDEPRRDFGSVRIVDDFPNNERLINGGPMPLAIQG